MNPSYVFVYGSLKEGFPAERMMDGANFVDHGKTVDRIFDMDTVEGAFPAVFDDGNRRITGEVYQVDKEHLMSLDFFEGHPHQYCRRIIEVELESGEIADAWMYVALPKLRMVCKPPEGPEVFFVQVDEEDDTEEWAYDEEAEDKSDISEWFFDEFDTDEPF